MSSSVINHHIKVCAFWVQQPIFFYYCGCLFVTIITPYLKVIFRKRHLALGMIMTLVASHLIQPASAFTFSAQSSTQRLKCRICLPLFLPLYLASRCHSQPACPLARRCRCLADTLFAAPSPLVALADSEVGCLATAGRGEKRKWGEADCRSAPVSWSRRRDRRMPSDGRDSQSEGVFCEIRG